jgi:hypothetical protein
MLGCDKRWRVGDYVRLAWQVANEDITVKEIDAGIQEIGADFPIDKAGNALRVANCYEGWQIEPRYFMFRYEEDERQVGERLGKLPSASPLRLTYFREHSQEIDEAIRRNSGD